MEKPRGLIALDLDGTLLAGPGSLSPGNAAALEQSASAGYIVAVVTGRPPDILPRAVREMACIRYIASATGARIWDRQTDMQLADHIIPPEAAVQVCALAGQNRCGVLLSYEGRQVMGLDGLVGMLRRRPPKMNMRPVKMAVMWMRFMSHVRYVRRVVNHAAASARPLLKCELMVPPGTEPADVLGQLACIPEIEPVKAGPHTIEVTAANATKGNAIAQICARHGLSRGEAVGFGDSGNDVSMRGEVDTLVAMENACDELKAFADYVAPPADRDGVAAGLRHLGIIQ